MAENTGAVKRDRECSDSSTPSPATKRHIDLPSPETCLQPINMGDDEIGNLLTQLKNGQDSLRSLVNSKVDFLRNEIIRNIDSKMKS